MLDVTFAVGRVVPEILKALCYFERVRTTRPATLNNTAEKTSYLANENLLPEMLTIGGKELHRRVCSFLTQSRQYFGFYPSNEFSASHNSNDPV